MKNRIIGLFFLGLTSLSLTAQDNHYWSQQFGANASFLGGSMIGGFEENSAIYYNPAALAFIDKSHFSLNTNVYKYEEAKLSDGVGEGIDLFSKRASLYPQMLSGLLSHNPDDKLKLAFSTLTRNQGNYDYSYRYSTFYNVLPTNPGDEYYIGSIDLQNHLSENWLGIGGGYRINENWSVGMSSFLSFRHQRYYYQVSAQASYVDSLNSSFLAVYSSEEAVRVNNLRAFFKAGLHLRKGHWRFGLTLTAPSVNIWGESRVHRELSFNNLYNRADAIYNDEQRGVSAVVKQPFSAGFGMVYVTSKHTYSFSTEYFGAVPLYKMVNAEARQVLFPSNSNTELIDFLSFYSFADAVLNLGIGGDFRLSKKLSLQTGFRTDFSSIRHVPSSFSLSVLDKSIFTAPIYDLYHFSSGITLHRRASLLQFGAAYSVGFTPDLPQLVNFTSPRYDRLLLGETNSKSDFFSQTWSLLVGYTYYFALN